MRRGQGAIEFVFITVVMLLFFTAAFIVAQQNYAEIQQARYQSSIYSSLDRIESELQVAFQAGEGYQRDIRVPKTIAGIPYELTLLTNNTPQQADTLLLNVSGEEYFRFIVVPVNGTMQTGRHRLSGGNPVQITTLS